MDLPRFKPFTRSLILLLLSGLGLLLISLSCGIQRPGPSLATGPVVVYKTWKDYRDHVTVQLSEDGGSLLAFPGPDDVLAQRPIELEDGYLLKRMVGNAYLSLTIEDYASSAKNYSAEELYDLVIDKKPYMEIYECSECSGGDTASINHLIRQGSLDCCKSLR